MELQALLDAILTGDALTARAWIIEAQRQNICWTHISQPHTTDPSALAVAAGIVDLLASRASQPSPSWTAAIPAAPSPVFLVRSALAMPRLRKLCEEQSPEPLRRRRVFAPPDYLTAA